MASGSLFSPAPDYEFAVRLIDPELSFVDGFYFVDAGGDVGVGGSLDGEGAVVIGVIGDDIGEAAIVLPDLYEVVVLFHDPVTVAGIPQEFDGSFSRAQSRPLPEASVRS